MRRLCCENGCAGPAGNPNRSCFPVSPTATRAANYITLRLPLTVEPVFIDWVQRNFPDRAEKITGRIKSMRDGKMNSSQFKTRMTGTGVLAEQVGIMFRTFSRKLGRVNTSTPRQLVSHSRNQTHWLAPRACIETFTTSQLTPTFLFENRPNALVDVRRELLPIVWRNEPDHDRHVSRSRRYESR